MDAPRFDFHIHTRHLGCANGTMETAAIVGECERLGLTAIALTDHLNRRDQAPLHELIRKEIAELDPRLAIYFGVELNYLECDGEFACDEELMRSSGWQFAIGGIHSTYLGDWDPGRIVDIQHRHHLKTCRDPLVDVLVHPYWYGSGEFARNGWTLFDSMEHVPASYARELGRVARETGTAIEINACAVLDPKRGERWVRSYVDYLRIVAGEGPLFSLASDAHDIGALRNISWAQEAARELGLTAERIWAPDCPPLRGPSRADAHSRSTR